MRGSVEIQQEDPSENYAATLGSSLRLFLGGSLFLDAWENSIHRWCLVIDDEKILFIDVCASSIYRSHVYL